MPVDGGLLTSQIVSFLVIFDVICVKLTNYR